jgi:hypothetical protein
MYKNNNRGIKPIATWHKGYPMRSRLEARWAVFFDSLGINWDYETEGYVFNGKHYLPDFHLSFFDGQEMFCEVKPQGGDFSMAYEFSMASMKKVWLCEGVPWFRAYKYLVPVNINGEIDIEEMIGIPNADQAEGENRMFAFPGYENNLDTIHEDQLLNLGLTFLKSVMAARAAKFEHDDRENFTKMATGRAATS